MSTKLIKLIKRDDCDFEVSFVDSDGNPIDLTNCEVFFTAKTNLTDTDDLAVMKKDVVSFDHPTLGIAILSFSKTDTDIAVGSYYFDIQLKTAAGAISSTSSGRLLLSQDITIRTVS